MKKSLKFIIIIFIFLFIVGCKDNKDILEETYDNLFAGVDLSNINENLNFIDKKGDVEIEWSTSNELVIAKDGKVTRQNEDEEVIIYITLKNKDKTIYKEITVTVKAITEEEILQLSYDKLMLPKTIYDNIDLPITILPIPSQTVSIEWTSNNEDVISNTGVVNRQEEDVRVSLYAKLLYNGNNMNKFFSVTVAGIGKVEKTLIEKAYDYLEFPSNTDQDLDFITNYQGVSILWETDNDAISNTGVINRTDKNEYVHVIATLNFENETLTKDFYITVIKINEDGDLMPYYNDASGLSGENLKDVLNDIIDDHRSYSYSSLWENLAKTDEDPNNPSNVILMYTGRSQSKSSHGGNVGQWNREHTWAKSHGDFDTRMPWGTDLHHLRPTDVVVNSTRGSKDFDNGGEIVSGTYGIGSSYCYTDSDSFEPRDEVKGDVARMMFYMATRYEVEDEGIDLELNDRVNNGSNPYIGRLSVLLEWNIEDPVDDFEKNRNEVIYQLQGNRNPFVDYPEFANLIWGSSTKTLQLKSDSDFSDISSNLYNVNAIIDRKIRQF